jgi:hypothetical protein
VTRHICQACPVWIYTQSNITNIIITRVHNTNTEKIITCSFKPVVRKYPSIVLLSSNSDICCSKVFLLLESLALNSTNENPTS